MNQTCRFDLHCFKISKDLGLPNDEIILKIPKWNLDLEARLRDKYFVPFTDIITKIDEQLLFDWILPSFDFQKCKHITSRRLINKARDKYIESLQAKLKMKGGKITSADESQLCTKMKIKNLMEIDIEKYHGDFSSVFEAASTDAAKEF